ncbi:MAG: AAA family ATPase [Candidatus Magasanikbacteria bacterium]|nr:AAA family ATPase [Candidatus Magasanikbacteria bacterium]
MAQNEKKIILGFSGLLSSGKGTAAKYLEEKYGASSYRFSTMLRDVLNRLYIEHSRDNLIKLSEIIRTTFGEDALAKTIAKDAETDPNPIIVVEGIRRLADISHLQQLPNFILVEIFADPKIRYERLVQRGENTDDKTKTYEQFLADHQRSTELSILEVLKQAKEKIDNNGNTLELQKQLDALVKKYQTE